ncbi:uncharacterized protein LOC108025046 isoform X2 [Drosophila biarmipes]|uniref:uncharacterized protein LOC108025046 isoform X2 n=1 Tax=Drosophila biarmipes TaxID=125945 RepID=UPI001CDAF3E4|nr:uncharacterized protein LOC108025046 isoform X2 [Drosophila biarmipes]
MCSSSKWVVMQSGLLFFLFCGFVMIDGQDTQSPEKNTYANTKLSERNIYYSNTEPFLHRAFKDKQIENVSSTTTFPNIYFEADYSSKNRLNRSSFGVRRQTDHLGRRTRNHRRKKH